MNLLYVRTNILISSLPTSYVKQYANADLHKKQILAGNKGKSGIYCWENKNNGKFYIGSAVDLNKRLQRYYTYSYLVNNSSMLICSGLLKHGFASFNLYILEYCNKEDLIEKEQYYFDLLKPNYNICKTAGSTLGRMHTKASKVKIGLASHKKGKSGFIHSEETKLKISEAMRAGPKGLYHPMYGKTLTEITKEKMRLAKLGEKHQGLGLTLTEEHKAKISTSQLNSQKISVLDLETNAETVYSSLREAAKALDCLAGSISYNLKIGKNKPFKGRFILKRLD